MEKLDKVSKAIEETIKAMMDRVMDNVLINDPFIPEEHHAKKPLYAALVPDEIFKGSHFERRFVTPFGKVWEKLAQVAGETAFGTAIIGKSIEGTIKNERLRRISEVLNKLEHPERGKFRIKPNWDEEIKYILAGDGEEIPVTVVCDLYVENEKEKYAFELKAPLPNSDQTKVSKEKILKLYSMTLPQVTGAFYALPYNPYGKKENYNWSFPMRWFDMRNDKSVLIGEEFWDLLGGEGTYQLFINEINKLGKSYRQRIYTEFLGIEPPDGDEDIRL